MLCIHCTAKLAQAARITLEVAPTPDDLYWLDCWYATIVPIENSKDLFLFINAQSLYSIVIPWEIENGAYFAVVAKFRQGLTDALVSVSDGMEDIAASTEGHDQYITCKTASRSILGSMNDIILFIGDYVEQNNAIITDDLEEILNKIPHSPLGHLNPIRKFKELVVGP